MQTYVCWVQVVVRRTFPELGRRGGEVHEGGLSAVNLPPLIARGASLVTHLTKQDLRYYILHRTLNCTQTQSLDCWCFDDQAALASWPLGTFLHIHVILSVPGQHSLRREHRKTHRSSGRHEFIVIRFTTRVSRGGSTTERSTARAKATSRQPPEWTWPDRVKACPRRRTHGRQVPIASPRTTAFASNSTCCGTAEDGMVGSHKHPISVSSWEQRGGLEGVSRDRV